MRTQNHGPIFAGSLVAEEIGVIKIIKWIAAPFFPGKNGRFLFLPSGVSYGTPISLNKGNPKMVF